MYTSDDGKQPKLDELKSHAHFSQSPAYTVLFHSTVHLARNFYRSESFRTLSPCKMDTCDLIEEICYELCKLLLLLLILYIRRLILRGFDRVQCPKLVYKDCATNIHDKSGTASIYIISYSFVLYFQMSVGVLDKGKLKTSSIIPVTVDGDINAVERATTAAARQRMFNSLKLRDPVLCLRSGKRLDTIPGL